MSQPNTNRRPEEILAMWRKLHKKGYTNADLGRELTLSRQRVAQIMTQVVDEDRRDGYLTIRIFDTETHRHEESLFNPINPSELREKP